MRGRLLAACSRGLLEIRGPEVTTLLTSPAWSVEASNDGTRVWVGTRNDGLQVFAVHPDGLRHVGRVPGTSDHLREIAEDASGRLWLRAFTPQRTERIERVDPGGGELAAWPVRIYEGERGPASPIDVMPFVWRGEILAGDPTGIYRFAEERDRFERHLGLEAAIHTPSSHVGAPTLDATGRLWFHMSPYRAGRAEVGPAGRVHLSFPLDRARIHEFLAFYAEPDGSAVWAGGVDGRVVRYDTTVERLVAGRVAGERPAALVRRVSVARAGGEVLFGGAGSPRERLVVPYASRALRFEYALPFFDARDANRYQTRLVGLGQAWSAWSRETYRDFTALPEGDYRFEVRGRDLLGRVSEMAAFDFKVLAPWYLTWWAYAIYAAAAAAAVALLVRIQVGKVERERARIEKLVEERTARLKILSGLLPICSRCKKIRDDEGYWNKLESYIDSHSEASFSHGLCPDCVEAVYPGLDLDDPDLGPA